MVTTLVHYLHVHKGSHSVLFVASDVHDPLQTRFHGNNVFIAPQADEQGLNPLWNPIDFPIAGFTFRHNNDSITPLGNYRAQGPKALGNWELVSGWPAV